MRMKPCLLHARMEKGEHAEEATIDRMELGYARMESNTAADGVARSIWSHATAFI